MTAQENKKRQILRIKSQVSRLLTNKYNSADLSLKFCLEEGGKGGGGFQSHITLNFFIESRITGNFFLINHASCRKE